MCDRKKGKNFDYCTKHGRCFIDFLQFPEPSWFEINVCGSCDFKNDKKIRLMERQKRSLG